MCGRRGIHELCHVGERIAVECAIEWCEEVPSGGVALPCLWGEKKHLESGAWGSSSGFRKDAGNRWRMRRQA